MAVQAALALVFCARVVSPAAAMKPNDPQRPFDANTCRAAVERVKEAANSSPLISQKESRDLLLAAIVQAERLCVERRDKLLVK
jgi:hypothetical protein